MAEIPEFYYQELRKNAELAEQEFKANQGLIYEYLSALNMLIELHDTARRNGLLALEEIIAQRKIEPLMLSNELERLILFVLDAIQPELIEQAARLKYYAGGYTGAKALLYLTYMYGALLIQAGTYFGTIEAPGDGLKLLKTISPPTIKAKLTAAEQKPGVLPEIALKPYEKRDAVKQALHGENGDWDDEYALRFLNNILPKMDDADIIKLNGDGYSYLHKGALFSILTPEAVKKLYGALSHKDAAVMQYAYQNPRRGTTGYEAVEIMYEVRELFGRIKTLFEQGKLKADIPLNDLMADEKPCGQGE